MFCFPHSGDALQGLCFSPFHKFTHVLLQVDEHLKETVLWDRHMFSETIMWSEMGKQQASYMIQKRKLQIKKKPEKLSFYLDCYHERHQQLKRKFPGFFPSIFEFLPRCHNTRVYPFAHDFPAISEENRLQDFSMINCLGTHLMCTGAHWTAETITVLRF